MDKEQIVFSAGNSWVVCRSKSHNGHIYYFNTLTGEAAWNLSDAEKEKARSRTQSLTKQNKINIDECPEPKEPPMDKAKDPPLLRNKHTSQSTSTIFNKQIINNQFAKPTSYPISPLIVPPFNQLVANPLNSTIPFTINAPNSAYSTNVWAVPPTHQIFISPTVAPLVNQCQTTSANSAYENQGHAVTVQHTTTSLSNRFQSLHTSSQQKQFQRWSKFSPTYKNNRFKERNFGYKNIKKNFCVNDLREVLSAKKRRRSASFSSSENNKGTLAGVNAELSSENDLPAYKFHNENYANHAEDSQRERNEFNDADSDWLEENILVENGKLKVNVSNLMKMAKPEMDTENWYIVADKDILLSHLNFLSILCNSDEKCCLMVAQQVMAELSELSRASIEQRAAARARRALAFLQQHLDAGYVVIGDGTCGENATRCDYILNCCSNLLEENHHVILLSNNEEFKAYKNETNIPIFNMKEIKQFLEKPVPEKQQDSVKHPTPNNTSEFHKPDRLKPPPCCKIKPQSTNLPIKITVNNEYVVNEDAPIGGEEKGIDKRSESVEQLDEIEADNSADNNFVKSTNEASVQTDNKMDTEPSVSNDGTIYSKRFPSEDAEKPLQHQANKIPTCNKSSKREIRLNRSISVKTTVSSEDASMESKHFRWRRKRHNSGTVGTIGSELSPNISTADENIRDFISAQKSNKETNLIGLQMPHNKSEESVSSETSSLLITRNLTNNTIVVDETSTSGIISNSPSNADTESESGKKLPYKPQFKQPAAPFKSAMFEITDKVMEESLRTMMDEWLSRFVLILEEVLTQVLRKDEQFLFGYVYKHHGGGPWTIREAADCIKIKFIDKDDIMDAANRITNIFLRISDYTGKIIASIGPTEYMEMYTVGVYLVSSLQRALPRCEDVSGAARALASLLADIKHPGDDTAHDTARDTTYDTFRDIQHPGLDTFLDAHPQQTSLTVTKPSTPDAQSPNSLNKPIEQSTPRKQVKRNSELTTERPNSAEKQSTPKKQIKIISVVTTEEPNTAEKQSTPRKQIKRNSKGTTKQPNSAEKASPSNYNLRSKIKSISPDNEDGVNKKKEPVKSIRNFDEQNSFFDSLKLIKRNTDRNPEITRTVSNEAEGVSQSQVLIRSIFDRDLNEAEKTTENAHNSEPTIIRKFLVCPDFEKHFTKNNERKEPLDMDQLDYSAMDEDDDLFMDEEYCPDNENYENENHLQIDENQVPALREEHTEEESYNDNEDVLTNPVQISHDLFRIGDDSNFIRDPPHNINYDLNRIFGTLISKAKESLQKIQSFCQVTHKELNECQEHSIRRKYEIIEKAERAQLKLNNLCDSLNSVTYRETYEPEKNVQSVLKDAGINDFNLNNNMLSLYRDEMNKCWEKSKILQESVALIVSVIKKQPIK